MQVQECIEARLSVINGEVMALVENQKLSLTEKNKQMKPLIDEKKVLEQTLEALRVIEQTDYAGRCSG